jgi:WD40 repeat protein
MAVPCLSNDGRFISFWEYDGYAHVWEVDTGKLVFERPCTEPIATAYFSADARVILTGSGHLIEAWDRLTGRLLGQVRGGTGSVIAPDGKSFAVIGHGVRMYRIPRSIASAAIPVKGQLIGFAAERPVFRYGRSFVAADPKTFRLERSSGSADIARSSDFKWRMFSDPEGIGVGPMSGGPTLFRIPKDSAVPTDFDASRNGRLFALVTPKAIRVVDDAGETIRTLTGAFSSVLFMPDGIRIVFDAGDGRVALADVRTGSILRTFHAETQNAVVGLAVSPDGRQLFFGGWGNGYLFDVDRDAPPLALVGHSSMITSGTFSADGSRVLTASLDGTARLWETRTGRQVLQLTGSGRQMSIACFDSGEGRIVIQEEPGEVRTYAMPLPRTF